MKPVTFKLDRCLYALLQDGDFQRFTIRQLRDAYASQSRCVGFSAAELWRYVHDQVVRLKRVGWVRLDAERRQRGQVYCVDAAPDSLNLDLVNGHGCPTEPALTDQRDEHSAEPPTSKPVLRLEALAKEIRLDMLSSVGEAERYKQLIAEMPQLQAQVEDDYLAARDRSSRLLGHLRAVEKTLKLLVKA